MIIHLDAIVGIIALILVGMDLSNGSYRVAAAIGMAALVLTVGWLLSGTPDLLSNAPWGL